MDQRVTIVGLGGSLGEPSSSLAALKIALTSVMHEGAGAQLLDVRRLELPMYEPGAAEPPQTVRLLVDTIHRADGLIWSSPMYHGTISGAFKNALDWLQLLSDRDPPYLVDKVVGLISTAGGVQGLQAVNTMEFVVRALRGWAVPLVVPIAQAHQAFDEQGRPNDPKVREQLEALGREVVRVAGRFATHTIEKPEEECAQAAARLRELAAAG